MYKKIIHWNKLNVIFTRFEFNFKANWWKIFGCRCYNHIFPDRLLHIVQLTIIHLLSTTECHMKQWNNTNIYNFLTNETHFPLLLWTNVDTDPKRSIEIHGNFGIKFPDLHENNKKFHVLSFFFIYLIDNFN